MRIFQDHLISTLIFTNYLTPSWIIFFERLKNILAAEWSSRSSSIHDILDQFSERINLDRSEEELDNLKQKQARRRQKQQYQSPPRPKTNDKTKEYYQILELQPGASFEEIKKALP